MNIVPDINRMHYVTQPACPGQTTSLRGLDNVEAHLSRTGRCFLLHGKKNRQQ
ncbi:hypothetical protein HMPREF0758_1254 [Serratia odorifera DSM 4582]|uniref:Uncharacterized protein n=1 Tax=Serratia odorifera DSM 4582 TaxID=667129 RepID=D4DZA4_SEROD|nr:hypothetical protein HMPREF0758_1254 [Serratia odorifera DSM 4582]